MTHSQQCGKRALLNAKTRFGSGWNFVGIEIQKALLSAEVVSLFHAQVFDRDNAQHFKDAWNHVEEASEYAFGLLTQDKP